MTVYDYGRSPEHWLLAIDIASRGVHYADPADSALEQFYWMKANDFDVAFVKGIMAPSIVFREHLATASEKSILADFMEPLPDEHCFPDTLSLNDAFLRLATTTWLVLTRSNQCIGVVTREDLAKPAASAFAFAHLIALERVLRRLVGTYTNHPISDEPQAADGANVASEVSGDSHVTLHQLSQVVNRVFRIPKLLEELGYSKREFRKVGSWAVRFRNHIAHSRRLNHDDPQQPISLTRFIAVQDLMMRAIELVENRNQVWLAFSDSVILDQTSKTMVAGPDATGLPFPEPCFVITAWNPFEQSLDDATNRLRNAMLLESLKMRTEQIRKVVGQSRCESWKEESFLVAGMDQQSVVDLASTFGQRAIFRLDREQKLVIDIQNAIRTCSPRCK
ncbi:hypothetical protein CA51_13430 [Rosistilla oblonga]|uniref:DUF3293 domain-containing protein n=1 Tax=Rosistilla oblonga TaxID=2527990 RepID=UPI001188CF89|nr:DUF3293 domain-containing protein [Rosistilla oblonga]QDV11479.1 hypothetical protein CA51_13430 [Rosistilla oblonga]